MTSKIKEYQQKKRQLAEQVFYILIDNGYIMLEEIKQILKNPQYPTTLATNFETITQAREVLRTFPQMEDVSVNYEDFCSLKNRILFTVKPRITEQKTQVQEPKYSENIIHEKQEPTP